MKSIWIFCLLITIAASQMTPAICRAAAKDIALTLKVRGEAEIKSQTRDWLSLAKGTKLQSGDEVQTGEDGFVVLVFSDDKSMMKIRSESQVSIRGEREKKGIRKRIFMGLGQLWAKINPQSVGFRLETPSGVAAVKGTEFYGLIDAEGNMAIIGIEGIIELFNELGSVLVNAGQTGKLSKDKAPELFDTVDLDDWASTDDGEQILQVEFENSDGQKKNLKIRLDKE
jgi:hypothetical protein